MIERLRLSQTNRPLDVITHWHKEGQLLLSPPYQRGDVWGPVRQRNLIRSILLGVPIPSIIINDRFQSGWGEEIAVIDGKQRITAVLAFLDDKFHAPGEWFDLPGLAKFSDLPDRQQRRLRQSPLPFTEGVLGSLEEEQEVFDLVNFGGLAQGQTDL